MSSEIASLHVKIGVDYKDLEAGLMQVGALLTSAGDAMKDIGRSMTMGITLPLIGIGVAATKASYDLDREMRNIQSISKDTDKSISQLRDTFIDMSTDINLTTASANELAEGFYQIQSSGFAGADAMMVLEASAMASTAGMTSVSTAATALTASLNAYGENANEAARYTDIMFRAVDIGVMSFDQLGNSLSNVLPTAAALGVNFETVTAAMATMTKQGMSASEASVALNQVLLSLMKPSEAMAAALHDIGFESGQAALSALGLEGVLTALADAGFTSATEMGDLFSNVRALRGALALSGDGLDMFRSDLDAVTASAGATKLAFDEQMKSIENRMKNLKNTATEALYGIFDALEPMFNAVVDGAGGMVSAFNDLGDSTKGFMVNVGLAVAAIGPLALGISKLLSLQGRLVGMSGVMLSMGGSLGGLAAAAGPAALAIATLVISLGALAAIKDAVEDIDAKSWSDFFEEYSSGAYTAAEATQAYIDKVQEAGRMEAMKQGITERTASMQVEAKTAEELADKYAEFNLMMMAISDNYGEYATAMKQAGYETQMFTQAAYNAARVELDLGTNAVEAAANILRTSKTFQEYTNRLQAAGLATQNVGIQTFFAMQSIMLLDDGVREAESGLNLFSAMAQEAADTQVFLKSALDAGVISQEDYARAIAQVEEGTFFMDEATKKGIESQIQLNNAMGKAVASMMAAGVSTDLQTATMTALQEAAGMATAEFDRQAATMDALSQAVNAGLISEEFFSQAMLDAANNTGLLNDAQLDLINSTLAAQAGYNTAAAAMGNYASSMYSLAGSFESATTAMDLGQIAMQAANQMWQSGAIDGYQYADMLKSINDKYGMFSEQSLQAATGVMQLNQAVISGALDATNYGDAYAMMLENIEAGRAPLEGILETFGTVEEKLKDISELTPDSIGGVLDKLKNAGLEEQLEGLSGWMDTTLKSAEALDGKAVEISFKSNASGAMADKIKEVNEAAAAAVSTEVTHTVNYVFNYIVNGSPPGGFGGGGAGTWSNTGGQFSGGDQYDPGTMSQSAAPTDKFSTTSLIPAGTLTLPAPETPKSAAPTYVSQDTYNVYNPLAAAILVEQKHMDILAAAEEVLK